MLHKDSTSSYSPTLAFLHYEAFHLMPLISQQVLDYLCLSSQHIVGPLFPLSYALAYNKVLHPCLLLDHEARHSSFWSCLLVQRQLFPLSRFKNHLHCNLHAIIGFLFNLISTSLTYLLMQTHSRVSVSGSSLFSPPLLKLIAAPK